MLVDLLAQLVDHNFELFCFRFDFFKQDYEHAIVAVLLLHLVVLLLLFRLLKECINLTPKPIKFLLLAISASLVHLVALLLNFSLDIFKLLGH